jgi:hypothetical protein
MSAPLPGALFAVFVSPAPHVKTGRVIGDVGSGHFAVEFEAPCVVDAYTASEMHDFHFFGTKAERDAFIANAEAHVKGAA